MSRIAGNRLHAEHQFLMDTEKLAENTCQKPKIMNLDRFPDHYQDNSRFKSLLEPSERLLDDFMLIKGQKLPCRHLAPYINGICTKCGLLMEYIPKEKD